MKIIKNGQHHNGDGKTKTIVVKSEVCMQNMKWLQKSFFGKVIHPMEIQFVFSKVVIE